MHAKTSPLQPLQLVLRFVLARQAAKTFNPPKLSQFEASLVHSHVTVCAPRHLMEERKKRKAEAEEVIPNGKRQRVRTVLQS
jgi:hypothetical protein